jgi:cell division protein ZapD
LRLEHLFAQSEHHLADTSKWGRRAVLATMLDIFIILSRHDLRTEVAKELAAQHHTLSRLQNHSGIDHSRLDNILQELHTLGQAMQNIPPQFASYQIRDNELLNSINNRSAIPGGTCGFDLPSFQHWLDREMDAQNDNVNQWFRNLEPFRVAINLVLRLVRESADPAEHMAHGGVLVHNTENDTQLIRVLVATGERVYPEISAGRHRSTIRFMEQTGAQLRVSQTGRDIPFKMACCKL